MNNSTPALPAEVAETLDVGSALGQNLSFGLVAGRCSAAQATALRSLRESKVYKRVTPEWRDFCERFLRMNRRQADYVIGLLDEFGPGYFELAQLTRISPETYRAVAPSIQNGALQHQGNAIELIAENSRQVAAAVAELRRGLPKKERSGPADMHRRIQALDRQCTRMVAEFTEIAAKEREGENFLAFTAVLTRMSGKLRGLEAQCGV